MDSRVLLICIVKLLLLLLCYCTYGEKCSCPDGCDAAANEQVHMYPNKVNVAVGKAATVSSRELYNSLSTGHRCDACLAINGLLNDTVDTPINQTSVNGSFVNETFLHQGTKNGCMTCDYMDYGGWWQVDLGKNYTITDLTIYTNGTSSLQGLQIHVDNQLCLVHTEGDYVFKNVSAANEMEKRIYHILCAWPVTGSVVRFSKPSAYSGPMSKPEINLCEVAVWACKAGYYGDTCSLFCKGHCHGNTCDRLNGTCLEGCQPGYYGDICDLECKGHCHGNKCDRLNGTCLDGCQPGYYGDICHLECKGHCHGSKCDRLNGTCLDACEAGYYGDDTCNLKCKGHCHGDTCDRISGKCPGDCATGYYGTDCTSKCGQCAEAGTCDRETGRCVSGCQYSWTGDFCTVNTHQCACAEPADGGCIQVPGISPDGIQNKENVAFGKQAFMSGRYKDGQGLSPPACAAVNGRTRTEYRTVNQSQPNCVHTSNFDYSPWWKVDLGRNYTITGVTIYRRADYHQSSTRMAGGRVWVDEQLCYTFPTSNKTDKLLALHHKLSVTCARPLRGQVITFSKDGDDDSHHFYPINICEFQVWVCKDGFYGKRCNKTCSKQCPGGLCDNYDGTCLKGCGPGHYGEGCRHRCGQCAGGGDCHHITGHCPRGCLRPGLLPPLCRHSCPIGNFGQNCQEMCGQCKNTAPCDVTTGHCQECSGSFTLPFCRGVNGSAGAGSRIPPHAGHFFQGGLVAGAIAGGLALIAFSIFIIGICHCRRQKRKNQAGRATESLELQREASQAAPPPYCQNPAFDANMDTASQPPRQRGQQREGEMVVGPRPCMGERDGRGVAERPRHPDLMRDERWESGLATKAATGGSNHGSCPWDDDTKVKV